MKRMAFGLFVALVSAHLVAQEPTARGRGAGRQSAPPLLGVTAIPNGWQARLDRPTDLITNLSFLAAGNGLHFVTGPAGVFYQPTSIAKGGYRVSAGFTQVIPSNYPEGHGLFIGGADLQGPKQHYTYFLVHQDGQFIIKRRIAGETKTIQDWTPHARIVKANGKTPAPNLLTIVVGPTVQFLVNGTEVARQPGTAVDTDGIAGLRVNHNLDLRVENFTLAQN